MPTTKVSALKKIIFRLKLPHFLSAFFLRHKILHFIVSDLLLLSLISLFVFQVYQFKSLRTSAPSLKSSPPISTSSSGATPRPIPHGPTDFSVSQSDETKPIFSKGLIDPYDPDPDALQTIIVSVKDIQPVTQVTAILKTDNNISPPISFQLIDGSPTDGTWQGSWTVSDTYLYTYNLLLTATSSRGESSIEITLR